MQTVKGGLPQTSTTASTNYQHLPIHALRFPHDTVDEQSVLLSEANSSPSVGIPPRLSPPVVLSSLIHHQLLALYGTISVWYKPAAIMLQWEENPSLDPISLLISCHIFASFFSKSPQKSWHQPIRPSPHHSVQPASCLTYQQCFDSGGATCSPRWSAQMILPHLLCFLVSFVRPPNGGFGHLYMISLNLVTWNISCILMTAMFTSLLNLRFAYPIASVSLLWPI